MTIPLFQNRITLCMRKYLQFKKHKINLFYLILLVLLLILFVTIPPCRKSLIMLKKKADQATLRYKMNMVKWFSFSEENALKEWEEKIFKNKVVYRIEKGKDLSYVRARSKASASALYYKVRLDAKSRRPVVSWKWKVEKFPIKKLPESIDTKNEDDFAARVYVIFPAAFFTKSKVLEYIWAETIPEGTVGTSPYSANIKLIVAKTGLDLEGKWFFEERDIAEDYKTAFGNAPEYDIGAVAFMTNAEHTGSSADAMYDEIKLGYKEGLVSKR